MQFIDPQDARAKAATDAIHSGDVTALRSFIRDHPEVVASRIGDAKEARTLLHILTDWPGHHPHNLETAKLLVSSGVDVNAPFIGKAHSETALHWAASCDDVEMIDALLDAGADIDVGGGVVAGTPLADARAFLQLKAAKRLVERGASVTLQDAATLGLMDRVAAFYEGDVSKEDTDNALWNACHGRQLAVAKFVHWKGANVNAVPGWQPMTPLDAAKRSEATEVVEWLLANGAKEHKNL